MKYKKFAIIRFCIRQTKMAFETPFVPRGLHFKFGPSGVNQHFGQNNSLTGQFRLIVLRFYYSHLAVVKGIKIEKFKLEIEIFLSDIVVGMISPNRGSSI